MALFSKFFPELEAAAKEASLNWEQRLGKYENRFSFTLYPAQRTALTQLLSKDGALLASEGGTGKTMMAAMYLALRTTRSENSVIVAPKGVHAQWQEEIRRFTGRRSTVVTSPGSLVPGINILNVEAFGNTATFNLPIKAIIADEAHFLANPSTQAISFLNTIWGTSLRVALTATPVPNRITELFSVLGWLSSPLWWGAITPDVAPPSASFPYHPWQRDAFTRDYALSEEEIGVPSPERITALLAPFIISITKNQCRSDLPPINVRYVPCLTAHSVKASWEKCFRFGASSPTEMDFLTAHPTRSLSKTIVALSKIQGILIQNRPVLVVSVRQEPLKALADALTRRSVSHAKIYSDAVTVSADEASRFQSGQAKVMLMGAKSAQSYSFAHCSDLIFIGSDFTYAMFYQALLRCHRVTSQRPVNASILYYPYSNERLALECVVDKARQATTLLGERDIKVASLPVYASVERFVVPEIEITSCAERLGLAPLGA